MFSPVIIGGGLADEALGDGGGRLPLRIVDVARPGRVVRGRPGPARAGGACRRSCAGSPGRWRSAGRTAPAPWRTRWPSAAPGRTRPRSRRTARCRCRRRSRCSSACWSPGGPTPARRPAARGSSRATLRVTSRSGTSSPPGASSGEGGQPVAVAGDDVGEVGGVAVEHERLGAVEHPAVAAPAGGRRRCRRAGRGARPPRRRRWRARAPAARSPSSSVVAEARRRRASPPPTTRSHGPGQRQRAHLLRQHDHLEQAEPGPAVRLGDEQPGPAQLGEPSPRGRR